MFIYKTPALLKYLYPALVWDKKQEVGKDKKIYITFDDGPIPEVTLPVLALLDQYAAKATFFCVGNNVERYPKLVAKIHEQGHRLGNHTYHHLNGWRYQDAVYHSDIKRCGALLSDFIDPTKPLLFRPPYGRIKKSQMDPLQGDYEIIMWDVLSGDFKATLAPQTCLQKSIQYTRPGTIIIFHDSIKARSMLAYVLPRYLRHFSEQGYEFVTL